MSEPNILLIILDSVRASNTSLHDYSNQTTPFLEEFAERATKYTQARSPGNTSLPSHTSIFTGFHVAEHGALDSIEHPVEPGHTIWDDLRDDGYSTAVFSHNPNITGGASLVRSFDEVYRGSVPFQNGADTREFADFRRKNESGSVPLDYLKFARQSDHPLHTLGNGAVAQLANVVTSPRLDRFRDKSADHYTDLFTEWLDDQNGPWGACINFMDAHHPYLPKYEHNRWAELGLLKRQSKVHLHPWQVHGGQLSLEQWAAFEPLYDGSIHQMDTAVEALITKLEQRGILDDTLVVVTADHGEGFGEPSRVRPNVNTVGHVAGIHETLLHVPLIVKRPGQHTGETVDELSSLTAFPSAVAAVRDGNSGGRLFVPDDPVVASSENIKEKLKNTKRAQKYCDDTNRFAGVARAVFEQEDEIIRKHITWGDDEVTVELRGGEATPVKKYNTRGRVDNVFTKFDNASILADGGVDDETRERLENLGYV